MRRASQKHHGSRRVDESVQTLRISLARSAARVGFALLALAFATSPCRAEDPTLLRWLGHGFFVLATSKGIKVAVDPFEPSRLGYQLPQKVAANILLVTHESDLANATDRIQGSPEVFRSTTATGVNRGAGLTFTGVRTFRDASRSPLVGRNVIFVFEVDGLRFAFIGALGHRLDDVERRSVGPVDIVVGAFGAPLGPEGLMAVASDLGAKVIIPAAYRTPRSGARPGLPELVDLVEMAPRVRRIESSTVALAAAGLPAEPEVWVLASPGPEQRKREGIAFPGMAENAWE